MTQEYQIRVSPQVASQEEQIKRYIAEEYGFDVRTVTGVRRRSATGHRCGSWSWWFVCCSPIDRTGVPSYRS